MPVSLHSFLCCFLSVVNLEIGWHSLYIKVRQGLRGLVWKKCRNLSSGGSEAFLAVYRKARLLGSQVLDRPGVLWDVMRHIMGWTMFKTISTSYCPPGGNLCAGLRGLDPVTPGGTLSLFQAGGIQVCLPLCQSSWLQSLRILYPGHFQTGKELVWRAWKYFNS